MPKATDHHQLWTETVRLLADSLAGSPQAANELIDRAFHGLNNDPRARLNRQGPPASIAVEWARILWDAECMDGHSALHRLLAACYRQRRTPDVALPGGFAALLQRLDAPCSERAAADRATEAPERHSDPTPAQGTAAQDSTLAETLATSLAAGGAAEASLTSPTASRAALVDGQRYHVPRPADDKARALASRQGLTLVVKGPEEMGKSRLLAGFLSQCLEHDKVQVCIDFSAFSGEDLADYRGFLSLLALMLLTELGQEPAQPPAIASQYAMNLFMERRVLAALQARLVIGLDEVDRLLGCPYQRDFFSMLRSWHNARPLKPLWQRLDLALVISTEPYLLIDDALRSPFNVGEIIELGPFSLEECLAFNRGYGAPLSADGVRRLWDLLGGQPRLTQTAFERLTSPERLSLDAMLGSAAEQHGPFGEHLRRLSARLGEAPELQSALRQILDGRGLPDPRVCDRLHGAGLVRWEGRRVKPANQLYARYFGGAL